MWEHLKLFLGIGNDASINKTKCESQKIIECIYCIYYIQTKWKILLIDFVTGCGLLDHAIILYTTSILYYLLNKKII